MSESGVDRLSGKIIGLGAGAIFMALVSGLCLRVWAMQPSGGRLSTFLFVALLWIAVTALSSFFIHGSNVAAIFAFGETIAFWAFLQSPFSFFTVSAAIILFFFTLAGLMRGKEMLANALRLNFWSVAGRSGSIIVTGLLLFVTVYLIGISALPEAAIPKSAFDFMFASADPILQKFIPGFSGTAPFDQSLRAIVKTRMGSDATEADIDQGVKDTREAIERTAGVPIPPNETFIDTVYQLLANRIGLLPPAAKTLTLVAIGVIVFGAVKWIGFLLTGIAALIAYLLWQLLRTANFFHIGNESAQREVIIIE